ncbi:hypothetical protein HanHA300_Chr15g0580901 [Helianthus annuus]|nr:hypothetical protein HanHA300_Chr15g0580901 [Helianthus annuus]KAJ0474522.1 hypothetical protein HanHA89_Chr15g0630621 [Helianthus annuus]KAJ0650079.1 hypothetical protein HanLR1_Chr15g0591541 [Helianthus annuus]
MIKYLLDYIKNIVGVRVCTYAWFLLPLIISLHYFISQFKTKEALTASLFQPTSQFTTIQHSGIHNHRHPYRPGTIYVLYSNYLFLTAETETDPLIIKFD